MQAVDADRLDARETECQACTRPTLARATARESVNTTNSSPAQPAKRAWRANSRHGQPCSESVDATDRSRGAPREWARREDKLIAWATRRWERATQTHARGATTS
jgi:hypothetical protein